MKSLSEAFTPMFCANYRVAISLTRLSAALGEYIDDFGLNTNPPFQREYVWTPKQQRAYCEHILRGGLTGRELYFNMPGWDSTFQGQMMLVDGKQRISALCGMLSNNVPVFGNYLQQYDDVARVLRGCYVYFNVNNLKDYRDVVLWYIDMNSGGTPHTEEEIAKAKALISE